MADLSMSRSTYTGPCAHHRHSSPVAARPSLPREVLRGLDEDKESCKKDTGTQANGVPDTFDRPATIFSHRLSRDYIDAGPAPPNRGRWSMINSTTNVSFLRSLTDACSRKIARREVLKTADFIHHWLYGEDEPVCVQKDLLRKRATKHLPPGRPESHNHPLIDLRCGSAAKSPPSPASKATASKGCS